jgi:hypothetical protein
MFFSAHIQTIDRELLVLFAGRADNADCAVGQKHRGDLEPWQLRYLFLPRRADFVRWGFLLFAVACMRAAHSGGVYQKPRRLNAQRRHQRAPEKVFPLAV